MNMKPENSCLSCGCEETTSKVGDSRMDENLESEDEYDDSIDRNL